MRKITILFATFIVLLSGCGIKKTYSLAQSESNITQIEIINVKSWFNYTPGSDYDFDVISKISERDYPSFLEAFHDVPCYSYYGSPYDGFMDDTIRITYKDGSFELIGEKAAYYEAANGEWTYPSYSFDEEAFKRCISSWKAIYQ